MIFGVLAILCAVQVLWVKPTKWILVWSWLTAVFVAGALLSLGYEFLAFLMVLSSTLSTIALYYYALSLGEHKITQQGFGIKIICPLVLGVVMAWLLWRGFGEPSMSAIIQGQNGQSVMMSVSDSDKTGMVNLGMRWLGKDWFILQLISVFILLGIIGSGTISRKTGRKAPEVMP